MGRGIRDNDRGARVKHTEQSFIRVIGDLFSEYDKQHKFRLDTNEHMVQPELNGKHGIQFQDNDAER